MKKLLLKGGDLQIFQFPDENKKEIYKALKDYGVLFSELPDLNRTDGLSEIVFHSEATNRVNQVIERISGQLIDMEEYLSNGEPEEIDKENEYFEKNFDPGLEPNKLSPEEAKELKDRMKIISAKNNPTEENITIAKKLVTKRDDEYVTRIPYERDKYIKLKKEDCIWINEKKTLLARIKKDEEYEIFDKSGRVKEKATGSALYKAHYDEVSVATKKRAMEQARKQSVINAKKRQPSSRKKGSR